jgi:hypothetical protein
MLCVCGGAVCGAACCCWPSAEVFDLPGGSVQQFGMLKCCSYEALDHNNLHLLQEAGLNGVIRCDCERVLLGPSNTAATVAVPCALAMLLPQSLCHVPQQCCCHGRCAMCHSNAAATVAVPCALAMLLRQSLCHVPQQCCCHSHCTMCQCCRSQVTFKCWHGRRLERFKGRLRCIM